MFVVNMSSLCKTAGLNFKNHISHHILNKCSPHRCGALKMDWKKPLSSLSESVETKVTSIKEIQPMVEESRDLYSTPALRSKLKGFSSLVDYRFMYPEFLPQTDDISRRHALCEKLERLDMLSRRRMLEIPEFYVGSVLAVTVSDPNAPGKSNRFVGICILREMRGLRANFTLRNVVDRQGVEIMYELYNPCVLKIEVLRLEKRLDEHLLYLRDADPEFSTYPFNMEAESHAENEPVPVNTTKVKLRPPPWFARWELWNLEGVMTLELPQESWDLKEKFDRPWLKWDLMLEYRKAIPEEEQLPIWQEVDLHHKEMKALRKTDRRKRLLLKGLERKEKPS